MPTIVGILTFISIINTTSESRSTVVECLTRDREAAGLSFTSVTVLWSLSKTHLLSPRFFKKASGILQSRPSICASVCPSVRLSVTLSPPKPFDEIQPNLVCELVTWMRRATAHFFCPGPGGGAKRFLFLFDLILYVHSTIFQLCGTGLPGLNQY